MRLPPFHRLIDAHGDELLAHARRLTDPVRAEDVVQEALLRALRAYPRLRHADHLRAWLHRIVFTTAMDVHRAAAHETPVADPVAASAGQDPADAPHLAPYRPSTGGMAPTHPGGAADDPFARDAFDAMIAPLSDAAQAALRLRFVEDLEYDAIAARLDCSSAAARQRVSTAVRTLRERSAA